jgi:hypothetical protein
MLDQKVALQLGEEVSRTRQPPFDDDVVEALVTQLAGDKAKATAIRKRMGSLPCVRLLQAYRESRDSISLDYIKTLNDSITSRDDGTEERLKAVLLRFNLDLKKVSRAGAASGVSGLEADPRHWPENSDMLAYHHRYDDPVRRRLQRLLDLESAVDSGDWATAAEHHRSLMRDAATRLDFDEVLEHINALTNIYQNDPLFSSALEELDMQRRGFVIFAKLWDNLSNGTGGSSGGLQQNAESLRALTRLMEENDAPQEYIHPMHIGQSVWDHAAESGNGEMFGSSYTKAQKDQWAQDLMQAFTRGSNDPQYRQALLSTQMKVLSLGRDIYHAELAGDRASIERALVQHSELEALAETEVGPLFIDVDQLPIDRARFLMKLQWLGSN